MQLTVGRTRAIAAPILMGLLALAALAQTTARPASAQGTAAVNENDPDRRQGLEYYQQHKMREAADLLEKVVAKYPQDKFAHLVFGATLAYRAELQTDMELRKADRLRARKEVTRARELGDDSDLGRTMLATVPEDGLDRAFSPSKEVDAAMQRGEDAFARRDFAQALKEYSHAFELDPKLYVAALNIGDTYYQLKQIDNAGEWFAKAIQIDRDREVAYRYWGDALMTTGKMKEARAKFLEGLAANPYAATSWNGLNNWVKANHLTYKNPKVRLPTPPTVDSQGKVTINLDPGLDKKDDGGTAWISYPMERALWHGEKFSKELPQEKKYRHSLKEETSALSLTAAVFEEIQQKKKVKNPDPSLVFLSQLKAEGLIEPYVLLVTPDAEIMTDFFAYQADHRDKLIQFLDKYLAPQVP